jgi:hypothetical protein
MYLKGHGTVEVMAVGDSSKLEAPLSGSPRACQVSSAGSVAMARSVRNGVYLNPRLLAHGDTIYVMVIGIPRCQALPVQCDVISLTRVASTLAQLLTSKYLWFVSKLSLAKFRTLNVVLGIEAQVNVAMTLNEHFRRILCSIFVEQPLSTPTARV